MVCRVGTVINLFWVGRRGLGSASGDCLLACRMMRVGGTFARYVDGGVRKDGRMKGRGVDVRYTGDMERTEV